MLAAAWTISTLCAVPQVIFFRVETHPDFPQFEQCVSNFVRPPVEIQVYSIFSVVTFYILPLVITLLTCGAVSCKLYFKSRRRLSRPNISAQVVSTISISSGKNVSVYPQCKMQCDSHKFEKNRRRNPSRIKQQSEQQQKYIESSKSVISHDCGYRGRICFLLDAILGDDIVVHYHTNILGAYA